MAAEEDRGGGSCATTRRILRFPEGRRVVRETELTPEDGRALAAGQAIAYYACPLGVRVEPGPVVVYRESAVPERPAAA